jgi:LysM repeat protein
MKIKIPKFLIVKKRKKLRATTARKPLRIAATADYDEMAEPNMKLSRALLIVLVLHVVAVSGIIAFNAIKTRQSSSSMAAPPMAVSSIAPAPSAKVDIPTTHGAATQKESPRRDDAKALHPVAKAIGKTEHVKAGAVDSGKVYVVAKGDNPVTIAKKLKVSYDELLALNHIDDPHKLQIGQKLLIPNKVPKAKKAE